MFKVSRSSPVVRLVSLLALSLLVASCTTYPPPVPYDRRFAGCRGGSPNPNSPVACVDVATLAVSPEPVKAFDRDSRDKEQKTPVQIIWLASDNRSNLRIEMVDKGCVGTVFCNGRGLCRAQTKDVSDEQQCKYNVRIGDRVNDPVVITVPCCMIRDDTEFDIP